jgi:hypothetical protein
MRLAGYVAFLYFHPFDMSHTLESRGDRTLDDLLIQPVKNNISAKIVTATWHQQKTEKRIEKMNHNNIIRHHFLLLQTMHSAQLKTWIDTTNSTHNLSGWRGSTLFTILLLPFQVLEDTWSQATSCSVLQVPRNEGLTSGEHDTHALPNSICISHKKKLIAYVQNGLPV